MYNISKDLRDWLDDDRIKYLINNNEFKKLFKIATNKFGIMSYELHQLIDIFKKTQIDPSLENDLDPVKRVIHKVAGQKATFLGWNYDYDEDEEAYTPYEGKEFTILGAEDLDGVDYNTDDEDDIFNDILWHIKYNNGSNSMETQVYGSSLELLKPLEELEVQLW